MPVMKFLSEQRWGSRRQWSSHHGSCANCATHRQHFSRLSSKCPGGLYHSSMASAQGPWATVPWLTLQCFLDSRETWEPLLSSLDIGQTSFLLSFLSCDCDKTPLCQGARWPDAELEILEHFEMLCPQDPDLSFPFHWRICLFQVFAILASLEVMSAM